jgi:hypothetical protein
MGSMHDFRHGIALAIVILMWGVNKAWRHGGPSAR